MAINLSHTPLASILIAEDKIFLNETELDVVLTDLEDRGLLGWDKRGNRYDVHPLVRGWVWANISGNERRELYSSLQAHFSSIRRTNWDDVRNEKDLIPYIELYSSLVALGRGEEAERLLRTQVDRLTQINTEAEKQ